MTSAGSPVTSTNYMEVYALSFQPFDDAPDGRFFYASPALMQRLDLLTHLTQFGESIILVSGPRGSGKTTLLTRFIGSAGKHWRLCLIGAEQFGQFGQRLGDALGIGDADDEQQLLEQWAARSDVPELLVVVIDNAEELSADAVQKLATLLDQPQADRVRLILFGAPEAVATVKQTLDGGNMQLLEIPKLSEEDTAAYLMYRLAVAGYSGENPFTPTEVRAICKAADGRPGNINRLAHNVLSERQLRRPGERLRSPRSRWPRRGIVGGVLVLLVLAAVLYANRGHLQAESALDANADHAAPGIEREIPLNLPASEPADVSDDPPVTTSAFTHSETPGANKVPSIGASEQGERAESAAEPATAAESVAAESVAAEPAAAEPAATEPAAAEPAAAEPAATEPAATEPAATEPAATESAATESAAEPAATGPVAAGPAAAEPAAAETVVAINSATAPTHGVAPVIATEMPASSTSVTADVPVQSAPAKTPDAVREAHREAWLLQQPPDSYSLQLLGSRHRQSVIDYIRQNNLPVDETAYYHGSYKGGDWYVLMYGIFPNRQSALDALANLPARIKKENPWPRSLASVHASIHAAQ